jgi:carbon-monoxide dehydrogenase small subunit
MDNRRAVSFSVNGEPVAREVPVRVNLADFLRNELGFTGTHVGCEHGVCGACTVLVDGAPVRACLMLAVQADGCSVETIEGLTDRGVIKALQDAFVAHNALQCGYCTPGILITAHDYLQSGGSANRTAIREQISANYCRCTGYQAIVDAIAEVAATRAKGGDG